MLFTSDLYSRKPVSYITFVIVPDSGARGDWEGSAPLRVRKELREKGVTGEYDEAYLPVRSPNNSTKSPATFHVNGGLNV